MNTKNRSLSVRDTLSLMRGGLHLISAPTCHDVQPYIDQLDSMSSEQRRKFIQDGNRQAKKERP